MVSQCKVKTHKIIMAKLELILLTIIVKNIKKILMDYKCRNDWLNYFLIHLQAKTVFGNFKNEYKNIYNEAFIKDFQAILE